MESAKAILVFLYNNKTKITGFLLAIVGALQSQTAVLQSWMTEGMFATFTTVMGTLVAVLGFINGKKPTIEK